MDAYDKEQGSYTPMGPSTADRIPRQQRLNALANPPVDRAWRDTSYRPSSGYVSYQPPPGELKKGAWANGKQIAVPKTAPKTVDEDDSSTEVGGVGGSDTEVGGVGESDTATTSTANATSRPMARSASSVNTQPAQPDQNNTPASEEPTVAQKNSTAAPFVQRRPQYQDTTQQSLRTTPGTPFNAQAPSSVFQNSMSDYEPERYEDNYGLFSIDPNMWFNDFLSDYGSFDSDMNLGLGIRY